MTNIEPAPITLPAALMKPFDLEKYMERLRIPEGGRQFLRELVKCPSRSPNGFISLTYRYPCHLSGHTLTLESRLEYAGALTFSGQRDVLRVLEQAPEVIAQGVSKSGAPITGKTKADLVVLRESGVEVYEVKMASAASKLCLENPNRFQETGAHKYGSKLFSDFFAAWGFTYTVLTEHDLDAAYVAAAEFLRPYRTGFPERPFEEAEINQVLHQVADRPGIYMSEINLPDERRQEVVLHMIGKGQIFTHLSEGAVGTSKDIRLYPTPIMEHAFMLLRKTSHTTASSRSDLLSKLGVGSTVEIKGSPWTVTKRSKDGFVLSDEDGNECPISAAALLDAEPRIIGLRVAVLKFEDRLKQATPEELERMLARYTAIQRLNQGLHVGKTSRSLRRWRLKFNAAAATGVGLDALLDRASGNKTSRLQPKIDRILSLLIDRYYLNADAPTARTIYQRLLVIVMRFRWGKMPTYETVARRCAAIDPYTKTYHRYGKKAAHQIAPIYIRGPIFSRHGAQASWHQAHCDSTDLDLLTYDEGVNRLHLIKLVDSFDGRVLAACLTEEEPSEATARKVITRCVEKHGRLPYQITFDWGVEGKSSYIQCTLEKLGVTVVFRPKSTPRSGTSVETMFGKLCRELLHNLQGSTKHLQKARMVTRAIDPTDRAVWTREGVTKLLDEYYDLINDIPRRNRRAPNAVAEECMAKFGCPPVQVPTVEAFRQMLFPYVDGIERTVSARGEVRHRDHAYSNTVLLRYAGKTVKVRFDEDDIQHVYVELNNGGYSLVPCVISGRLRQMSQTEAMDEHERIYADAKKHKQEAEYRKAVFMYNALKTQKSLAQEKKKRARRVMKAWPKNSASGDVKSVSVNASAPTKTLGLTRIIKN